MNEAIRDALKAHLDWLQNLRWIGRTERVLLIACAALLLLSLAVLPVFGHWSAAWPAALGHILLVLACGYLAPRWLSSAGLALIALSLLNFTILSFSPARGLAWLGIGIGGLGLLSLPFTIAGHFRLGRRWQATADYRGRDDFRWLLTQAPLVLRWQAARTLASLTGAGHDDRATADRS